MTDETRDDTKPGAEEKPDAEQTRDADQKREAERRGGGRRVAERKPETVRAAIRDQLAEDAPELEEREAEKEKSGESEAVIASS